MFKELRYRIIHTISAIGIGCFLLLFGTIYVINYNTVKQNIDESLDKSLAFYAQQNSPIIDDGLGAEMRIVQNCGMIEITRAGVLLTYNFEVYSDDEIANIVKLAEQALTEESSKEFTYGSSTFKVESCIKPNDSTLIAVLDISEYKHMMKTLWLTLITALLVSSGFVVASSFLISKNILSPTVTAWKQQQELIANVSHELKTPITIIDTNIAAIEESDNVGAENQKWLDNISNQNIRMNSMVCQMLELSKLENTQKIIKTEFDASELISGILLGYEAAMFERNIALECNIDNDLKLITDKDLFQRVVYIFIDNALKYTKNGGKISVRFNKYKKETVFVIRNTCSGIPESERSKLFNRFYRGDKVRTQSHSNSFGLGLSIAKSAANLMRADIYVDSDGASYAEFGIKYKN